MNEKVRGGFMSIVSGTTAGLLTLLGVKLGLSAPASSAIFLYGVGNVIAYMLDIVFAKRAFKGVDVPYTALGRRLTIFTKSLVTVQFFRFGITAIIDCLIGIALLKAAMKYMDEHSILAGFKYRDTVVSVAIATFTFLLYVNTLRFDWAYSHNRNPTMDMIVYMWVSVALLMFAFTYIMSDSNPLEKPSVHGTGSGIPLTNRWGVTVAHTP